MNLRGLLAALAAAAVLGGCHKSKSPAPAQNVALQPTAFFGPAPDGKLHVDVLDVGLGSAALIVSPSGSAVLVDGGPHAAAGHVVNRLPELLHAAPEWTFLTTPRPEHLGGLNYALRAVGTHRFLDPDVPSEQGDLAGLKQLLDERHIERVLPHPDPKDPGAPLTIDLGGDTTVQIFWPRFPREALLSAAHQTPELNSLVFRVIYRDTSVLFMGDAIADTERYLLEKRFPFRSTVLVVGDHGSDRATTPALLAAVQPKLAVISSADGGGKGPQLPSPIVLGRLTEAGARVFRTDLDGEVQLTLDGDQVAVTTEHAQAGATGQPLSVPASSPSAPAPAPEASGATASTGPESEPATAHLPANVRYVASKRSNLFHLPNCRHARQIRPENLITFTSRSEAMRTRKPASDCHP